MSEPLVEPISLLQAALDYAHRGWPVFPCHTPLPGGECSCRRACGRVGKHPRTRNGLKDATTDETVIRRWWKQWPQANVAVVTGSGSGLVVLDEDTYRGGDDARQALEHQHGDLPSTVLQLTGGGGVQFFFAHPGETIRNSVQSLGTGLDVRGDGGYVVMPPSLHLSGRQYAWELTCHPDDMPLATLPTWLLQHLRTTWRPMAQADAPIPQGERNNRLFQLGCVLRARGFTEAAIMASLIAINTTQCQPPLDEPEVVMIAASCASYPVGGPQPLDTGSATHATPAPGVMYQAPPNGRTVDDLPPDEPPPPPTDVDIPLDLAEVPDPPTPLSDVSNAERMLTTYSPMLRFCPAWDKWLIWTGTHWHRDEMGQVMELARQTIKRLVRLAVDADDQFLLRHATRSLGNGRLVAMMQQAQSMQPMPIRSEDCDTHLWQLNCLNGTLDLHTAVLGPHVREDLLTHCLSIAYDPDAICPTWERFLWRIMGGITPGDDEETLSAAALEARSMADVAAANLCAFLQRVVGYTLTGDTSEEALFILHGTGQNGKSKFLEALARILGPYACSTPSGTFMAQDHERIPNDLARLRGARLVTGIELNKDRRLNEELILRATGRDPVTARFLYGEYFEFYPQFKLFMACNNLPNVRSVDKGMWRRIHQIPFAVEIPDDERDKQLGDKLAQELPGILAWAVRGCLAWQERGLDPPAQVQAATQAYKEEMDTIGRFLVDCCAILPDAQVRGSALYAAYRQWCQDNNVREESSTAFGRSLEGRGFPKRESHGVWRVGLGLRQES